MYLLWHCDHNGWLTSSGNTTSILADAWRLTRTDAVSHTRARRDHNDNFVVIPVAEEDLNQAMGSEGRSAID